MCGLQCRFVDGRRCVADTQRIAIDRIRKGLLLDESIRTKLTELVARFDRNRETYQSAGYNETQTRREFIDPLFALLGWDMVNRAGYAEAYKDVIHEDAIKVGVATEAPDVHFRFQGLASLATRSPSLRDFNYRDRASSLNHCLNHATAAARIGGGKSWSPAYQT